MSTIKRFVCRTCGIGGGFHDNACPDASEPDERDWSEEGAADYVYKTYRTSTYPNGDPPEVTAALRRSMRKVQ